MFALDTRVDSVYSALYVAVVQYVKGMNCSLKKVLQMHRDSVCAAWSKPASFFATFL